MSNSDARTALQIAAVTLTTAAVAVLWILVGAEADDLRLDQDIALMSGALGRGRARSLEALRARRPLTMPRAGDGRPCIVLIPGLACSPLYTRDSRGAWERVWLSLDAIAPKGRLRTRRWRARMMLRYNAQTRSLEDGPEPCTAWREDNYPHGRFQLTDDVGGVAGVCDMLISSSLWLPPGDLAASKVFRPFIDRLLRQYNYSIGRDLFGIGYDFRRIADGAYWPAFVRRLADLLRYAVACNYGAPVVLVSHSLGGLLAHGFINASAETQQLARDHVSRLIMVNTPWLGATRSLQAVLLGSSSGLAPVGPPGQSAWFQELQSTMSCMHLTLPRAAHRVCEIAWADRPPSHYNGSPRDLERLLRDTSNAAAADMYRDVTAPWLARHLHTGWQPPTFALCTQHTGDRANLLSMRVTPRGQQNPYAPRDTFAALYTMLREDARFESSGAYYNASSFMRHSVLQWHAVRLQPEPVDDAVRFDGVGARVGRSVSLSGDGIVPLASLAARVGEPGVHTLSLVSPHIDHAGSITHPAVHAMIMMLVSASTASTA